jgi:DNA polymerase-3 subunit delta'
MAALSALFGQDMAVTALQRALESDRLAGAYLFVGADGTGKRTVAQALAQAAACTHPIPTPYDACGECESCRRAQSGAHPDIATIAPAGEQILIGQLWDRQGKQGAGVLSRTLSFAPVVGRRRVYIVEKADRLSEAAANSLLKVLEEPPPYALFLLLAPHPARVLPTILSRCQVIRLRAVPRSDLAAFLQETASLNSERAATVAAYSEGRIGQAVTLSKGSAIGAEIGRVLDFAESLPQAPRYRALRAAEQLRKLASQAIALVGEEAQEASEAASAQADAGSVKEKTARKQYAAVFDLLVTFYRDLLAIRVGASAGALVNLDRVNTLRGLAAAGSPERWRACLDALLSARRRLDANANIALVTEILLMNLLDNRSPA